ncbi:MAG: hypothetical protein JSS94_06805 [Bacteroidetes bacterium]|nr:hypothetical protein [Bacteroidota bacterium]
MNIIEKYYVYDEKGEFFFKNFRLFDGRFLDNITQNTYTIDASIFNTIILIENNHKNSILGKKKTGFWFKITELVNGIDREKLNHSLPKSEKHIKGRCKLYKDKGYLALVSGLYGNNNSRKVDNSVENLLKSIKEQNSELITYPKIRNTIQNFLEDKIVVIDKTTGLPFKIEDFDIDKLSNISLSTIKNYINLNIDESKYNPLNISESEISNDFFSKFKQLDQQKRISLLKQFTEIISLID